MATILVIDDSEGQRAEVRSALESSGLFDRVLEARDGIRGLKLLLSEPVDLVLCDLEMPGLDGEKLLRMKSAARDAEIPVPFVVLTGVYDVERRARLLEDGASDAITKPFHAADLIARVALHLKLVRTQRELVEKNRALERLSSTDALTGLANRRCLDERLASEFRRSRRSQTPFGVAMVDVDHFKRVNDEHGHPTGDALLVEIARITHDMVREIDCAGRFGGEEFLVILAHNDVDGAEVFAQRLRRRLSGVEVPTPGGRALTVTVSIGVAAWEPGLAGPEALVARVDQALYQAKSGGRDRVVRYGEG